MSANTIYDCASLGSVIQYFDGTPKPPARFTRKVADWEGRNGTGRLVKKEPPRVCRDLSRMRFGKVCIS